MFFGLRRLEVMLKMLLTFLGLSFLFRERLSETDRQKLRQKAHLFRHKINEAMDVWDTDTQD